MNNIGMRRLLQILLLSALVLVSMTQRADATFHIMVIAELYPGSYANPDAQYVMLQSLASFQNQIGGKAIITFNPDGTRGPDFGTFAANSTNTASGAHYLMTTSAAQTFFGFTRADGTASGRMPFPSGRICFVDPVFGTVVDCVAYGAYTGSNIGYGAPAAGLVSQKALVRVVFNTLSKNNATDFTSGSPNPINSFGDTSPDGDGDGVPNVSDCAPGDSSVYLVPFEAKNMVVTRATGPTGLVTHVAWDDQSLLVGPQTVYDLVSGDLASLHAPIPFAGAACLASKLPAPSFDDATSDPGAGLGVYYLSRARNGCGNGTYGDSSLSPDPRDFLDSPSTTPCP